MKEIELFYFTFYPQTLCYKFDIQMVSLQYGSVYVLEVAMVYWNIFHSIHIGILVYGCEYALNTPASKHKSCYNVDIFGPFYRQRFDVSADVWSNLMRCYSFFRNPYKNEYQDDGEINCLFQLETVWSEAWNLLLPFNEEKKSDLQ